MGIFSDNLEEVRDAGYCDPCMCNSDRVHGKFYSKSEENFKLQHKIEANRKCEKEENKKLIRKQYEENLRKLETLKRKELLREKIVLSVCNTVKFKSGLIEDTVKLLLGEISESYQAICDLMQEINSKLEKRIVVDCVTPTEKDIRIDLMKKLDESIIGYLQDSSVILDTSEFRKVVFDFAEIIRYFEQEQYNQPDKKIVCYHLEKNHNIKNSQLKCTNCGKLLFDNIPYCLNCYERN